MDFANTQEMDTEAASKSKEPLEDAESSKPPLLPANTVQADLKGSLIFRSP